MSEIVVGEGIESLTVAEAVCTDDAEYVFDEPDDRDDRTLSEFEG